jgi:hypothetical protein
MQFIVFIDLFGSVGTVVLPVAIALTYLLIATIATKDLLGSHPRLAVFSVFRLCLSSSRLAPFSRSLRASRASFLRIAGLRADIPHVLNRLRSPSSRLESLTLRNHPFRVGSPVHSTYVATLLVLGPKSFRSCPPAFSTS